MEDQDNRTIWCGNLSDKVTAEILFELFLQAGPLDRVNIPKDKDGRQRNYGFITYVHEETVPYALELFKGTRLFNRSIAIKHRIANSRNNPFENVSFDEELLQVKQFQIRELNERMDKSSIYDRLGSKDLSMASLQGNWSSRSQTFGRDRPSSRYEPYSRKSDEYRHDHSRDKVNDRPERGYNKSRSHRDSRDSRSHGQRNNYRY